MLTQKFGWIRDYPDFRDYTLTKLPIANELAKLKLVNAEDPKKSRVDLRDWCSLIEDQGQLGSCTANAAVALIEYFEQRAFGKHVDASRLFIYKVTRNLMELTGDTGASLRATMGALVLFGAPPEKFWSYEAENFETEPSAFCYAFGDNYRTLNYYRLDPPGITAEALLKQIKTNLKTGLPIMFGFTVYNSISQVTKTGKIPFPTAGEKAVGGHAIVAVGYDDGMEVANPIKGGTKTTGALLIRNSWGTGWGEDGYGWLPYEYVLKGLAVDWWSIVKSEWIDTGEFGV